MLDCQRSASFGGEGASLACFYLANSAKQYLASHKVMPDKEQVLQWIDDLRDKLQLAASRKQVKVREFASTLVMCIVNNDVLITIHVGDGAIVARKRDDSSWVTLSKPAHGEYASTTYFLTDEPEVALRVTSHVNTYDVVCSFTDGIENLVLHPSTNEPHADFFNPISRPVIHSSVQGFDQALSRKLANYLDSESVNSITDDDKTILIAVQRKVS